jgi:hypothetical protein
LQIAEQSSGSGPIALLDRPPALIARGKVVAMTSQRQGRIRTALAASSPAFDPAAAPAGARKVLIAEKRNPEDVAATQADQTATTAVGDVNDASNSTSNSISGAPRSSDFSSATSITGSALLADASPNDDSRMSLRDRIPRPAF